jgi:hypothetical protein
MDANRIRRFVAPVAVVVGLALALAACGSSGEEVGVRGNAGAVAGALNTAPPAAVGDGGATKSVAYHGIEFTVPGNWPVYDLTADPTTCVRFDVHAVYLGHPGADMRCPAIVVGRTDAVLVEPVDGSTAAANGAAHASEAGQLNGLSVATDRSALIEHEVYATFADQGVEATVSFSTEDQANQVLGSFTAATK